MTFINIISVDLNNFIKNRVTVKSSDLTSCLAMKHSGPYSKIGNAFTIDYY